MGTSITFIAMIMGMLFQVCGLIVFKVAFSSGMNKYILIVYSGAISTLILLPLSLIFHRSERPTLTASILFRIFLLSLIGFLIKIFACVGIEYSSPMLGSAMLNLIPAFTFLLAIIFRLEKLNWRSTSSLAKLSGTILSTIGAFIMILYKGIPLLKISSINFLPQQLLSPKSNWVLGGFFLAAEAFLISACYILQAFIIRKFPAIFTIMFYTSFFGIILSGLYSFFVVDDADAWHLRPDAGLVAVLYAAIMSGIIEDSIYTWSLSKAGPLYISMFKPLTIIFAVVLDFIFLKESLALGSLIGATVIVTGFYAVMWGKAKEEYVSGDHHTESGTSTKSNERVPLL